MDASLPAIETDNQRAFDDDSDPLRAAPDDPWQRSPGDPAKTAPTSVIPGPEPGIHAHG
ncbi:hypothetical protein CUJ84_Chr000811 [Rhizobium leguminosarum]|uniref:Uncharacterized protein n=1 Tax=Rhizobium leguminosarum TaxID=384 RepID=A0A2K9YZ09_RHILE|nr:hypothetical protein CUJ84_Chr000811 [Rhizobium leguminosarum]